MEIFNSKELVPYLLDHQWMLNVFYTLFLINFAIPKIRKVKDLYRDYFQEIKLKKFEEVLENKHLTEDGELYQEAYSQELLWVTLKARVNKKQRTAIKLLLVDGIATTDEINKVAWHIRYINNRPSIKITWIDNVLQWYAISFYFAGIAIGVTLFSALLSSGKIKEQPIVLLLPIVCFLGAAMTLGVANSIIVAKKMKEKIIEKYT